MEASFTDLSAIVLAMTAETTTSYEENNLASSSSVRVDGNPSMYNLTLTRHLIPVAQCFFRGQHF